MQMWTSTSAVRISYRKQSHFERFKSLLQDRFCRQGSISTVSSPNPKRTSCTAERYMCVAVDLSIDTCWPPAQSSILLVEVLSLYVATEADKLPFRIYCRTSCAIWKRYCSREQLTEDEGHVLVADICTVATYTVPLVL